jgi:hypothetical protein
MRSSTIVIGVMAAFLLPGVAPGASTIWLEAEQFRDLGGWTNDAQFIDQMGSPYLLAIGLTGPVKDAATQIRVPATGKYRLWARTRDWVPAHSPGRFQIALRGKPLGHVFGEGKAKGWVWEDGGVQDLAGGDLEVRLHDLTGHYGRCDAIVLTDDLDYRPPEERSALMAARLQCGGVSREMERQGPYDTIVVGGGLAGTMAAIASARLGAKTALLQDRPVLGGNTSTEILVEPQGDTTREPLDPGETGIIEEFRGPADQYSGRMLKLCKAEPKLDLFLNTHATGVTLTSPGKIGAVETLEVSTGRRRAFAGSTFIDCTGDGVVGVWAGAEYRHGREPRAAYRETRAPEHGDAGTMGGTLRYATEVRPAPAPFTAPTWAHKFSKCSDFAPERHPQLRFGGWQWVIEYGGVLNTYDDAEEIRDELLRIIWGMWDHAKNHCPKLTGEAKKFDLVWVSHVVGKRESRRLVGDYVMTEYDIHPSRLFEDRVSYGGWGVDLHPPKGFYDPGPPATFSHKFKFAVPFRSLYSKDVGNLMMAGRDISVSHAALGATRVMVTCGLQGQAVGTAAALCKVHQTTPKGLCQSRISELQQQLLKDGCYLIDLPNTDPSDLALGAKATASSFSPPAPISAPDGRKSHRLDCDRAVMFPVTRPEIRKLAVWLDSAIASPVPVTLTLRGAAELGDFRSTKDLGTAKATVPPRAKGWVEFSFGVSVKPGYYYAFLPKTAGLSWSLFDAAPPETSRAYRSGTAWTTMPDCYRFRLDPPSASETAIAEHQRERPPATMFAPANVVNGYARAVRGWPNSWRPEPGQNLPQWVELDFGRDVAFNCVHVSFQSRELRGDAFRLEVRRANEWQTVAEVSGNRQRRRVMRFPPISSAQLRLVIVEANREMGVCEIRVYNER